MKKIEYAITQGGSEHGLSYYLSFVKGCPRQVTWRKLQDLELTEEERILKYQVRAQGVEGKKNGANVGTLGHVLIEAFFQQGLKDPKLLAWTHPINDTDWAEACRCFQAWREFVGNPDCFGRVVEVEYDLPHGPRTNDKDHGRGTPNAKRREAEISKAIGVSPFTARLDLIVNLTKKDIKKIKKTWGSSLLGEEELIPGFWIVDHKFYASESKTAYIQACESLQFTAYPLAWNAVYKSLSRVNEANRKYKPVLGTLQNTIYKTSTPKCRLYVVPFPSLDQVRRLHSQLNIAVDIINNRPEEPRGPCRHPIYGTECEFKTNRMCKGF